MKRTITTLTTFALLLLAAGLSFADDSLVVSQVDNSQLLAGQKIRVYVSVTNPGGNSIGGLQKEQFKVAEGPEGGKLAERSIIDFLGGGAMNEGMAIGLVLDNSGSMYTTMAGRETKNDSAMRITYAKQAINDFLPKIANPNDRVALIAFNQTIMTNEVPLTDSKADVMKALTGLRQPEKNQQFTELYESLYYAITTMSHIPGRKVIILLTDGENYPYVPPKGKTHPQFTVRRGLDGALELAQREGISVFTIGIGSGSFQNTLRKISNETGGMSYQVTNLNQLKELYSTIQERVLGEYVMTYFAGMEPALRKTVRVEFRRTPKAAALTGTRAYYAATLFGRPQEPFAPWVFAFLLLALLILFLLWILKFGSRKQDASLSVLAVDGKRSRIQPVTIMETQREVTISGDSDADLTISGDSKLANSEVKLFKEGSDYTLMSGQGTVKVNNQPVKAKKLRSGDLITVGNTTIVFDGGNLKRDPTRLMEKTKTSRLKSKDKRGRSTRTPHN
ncbi:MAG: VWA domain-containing protein [Spirochaetales bacterium]|nr:VWA domain-containing protein [Spirochaetales bacterium]